MIFVDSNVWLYGLLLPPHPTKRQRAIELCATPGVCVSSQVVNEVLANYRKKQPASEAEVRKILDEFYSEYEVLEVLQEDISLASELREEYLLTYWDSLMVASGLRAKAETFYSEDMQDGLRIRNRMTIRNPFL